MTEEKEKYATIREIFEEHLDDRNCQVFRMALNGQCYGANSKGRPARISVGLPKTICGTNLKDLDDWILIGIAIPRDDEK